MHQLAEIKRNLETIQTISTITTVYQETSRMKMNQIRDGVLETRKFLEGISSVHYRAKKSYAWKSKKENRDISFLRRNKKTVIVFLSSNERFYGNLIAEIWRNILNHLNDNEADLFVTGKIGRTLAENARQRIKFEYSYLSDEKTAIQEVRPIIDFIKKYEKILVMHGKFLTTLLQKPFASNVATSINLEEGDEKSPSIKDYLFEPSPRAILEFFETEMISALFNQALLEHRLSKYAARMIAMYQANENIKNEQKKLKKLQKQITRELLNKKQLEAFSGFGLWTKN